MNFAITIFVFCIAGAFAGTLAGKKNLYDINSCLVDFGIDPDVYVANNIPFPSEQYYCPFACVYKNMGIMKPDGTIDLTKVGAYTKDNIEDTNNFYKVHNACKDGRIGCSLVQCMFKELFHTSM